MGFDVVKKDIWRYLIEKLNLEQGNTDNLTVSKTIQPVTSIDLLTKKTKVYEEIVTNEGNPATAEFYPDPGKIWIVKSICFIPTQDREFTATLSLPDGNFTLAGGTILTDVLHWLHELNGLPLETTLKNDEGIEVTISTGTAGSVTIQLLVEEYD